MLKRSITYIDPWTEEKVTEPFYFNFTEMELVRLQNEHKGKLQDEIEHIGSGTATQREILGLFEEFISKSYGERSESGRFIKSKEITEAFLASEPYSELVIGFFRSENGGVEAAEFLNSLMPKELMARAEAMKKEKVVSDQPSAERTAELRARLMGGTPVRPEPTEVPKQDPSNETGD